MFHQPAFIEHWDPHGWEQQGQKYWNKHVRTILLPELIKKGVNLIINGHQHAYSRGWLGVAMMKALTDTDPTMFHNSSEARANARGLGYRVHTATRARMQEGSDKNSDSAGGSGSSSAAGGTAMDGSSSSSGNASGKKDEEMTHDVPVNKGHVSNGHGKFRPSHASPGPRDASPGPRDASPGPRSRGTLSPLTNQKRFRQLLHETSPNPLDSKTSPGPRDIRGNATKDNNEKGKTLPIPVYTTTPGHAMLVTIGGEYLISLSSYLKYITFQTNTPD